MSTLADDRDRRWAGAMPETYDRCLGPALFLPHALDLARRAAGLQPRHVLELAAGTGLATRALAEAVPGARITATDLNDAMVEYAASRISGVEWRPADATALPFSRESFDLVTCQFGVMFFPDRQAAYREVRRVLTPGGRFLFNTWDAIERNDFAAFVAEALGQVFEEDHPPSFLQRVPYAYHDIGAISADLDAAGLQVDEVETLALTGRAESPAQVAEGFCQGTPLGLEIEKRASLAETTLKVAELLGARHATGPWAGTLTAHVITAHC